MDNQPNKDWNNKLSLSDSSISFLKETAKWAYFLSIIGFIGIGFIVLMAIFIGTFSGVMADSPVSGFVGGTFLTVLYLLMALLYFFPIYYLFNFSRNTIRAIAENNTGQLTTALSFLKSHYKFIGILTVILLGIYILAFFFGMLGALIA